MKWFLEMKNALSPVLLLPDLLLKVLKLSAACVALLVPLTMYTLKTEI